jgi:hypothetical protein
MAPKSVHYTRLERHFCDKHSSLLGEFVSYKENEVMWIRSLVTIYFISFVTYQWAQKATAVHNIRLEKLYCDKLSSLLEEFVSYKENEVLWIWPLWPYTQHFISFVTYQWAQKATVVHYIRLENLYCDKNSSLLEEFVSYKENEVMWIRPLWPYTSFSL